MSETITPETPTAEVAPAESGATPETPVELGENGLKALAAERDARKAAETVSADLAKQLKAFADRDKTDAERQAEETETLRRENAELKSGALRAEVANAKGVPVALLSGSTQEQLEASADALIAFRGEKTTNRLVVPNEGNSPSTQGSSDSVFAASLFGSGN